MMGKAEIHDFFRFAESNGTTTTEPGTGRTVGLVGGVGAAGPLYDSNYTYAEYNFTDPGVYAEDNNADFDISKGFPDLDGDGIGEGFATVRVSDRADMVTCENAGIIYVHSCFEEKSLDMKDWQALLATGSFGYNSQLLEDLNASISPAKIPDVLGAGYSYGDSNQTVLVNLDMTVLTIEYRVRDGWGNFSSIMTRQLYVYESQKYAGTAIYAQPLTDLHGNPFEDYDNNGTVGSNPALSGARKDTDGDGASDFWEAALGTDRMDLNSRPDLGAPSTFQNLSTPDLTTRLNALPDSHRLTGVHGISGFGAVQALP
jgi:hypothetical protein